MNADDLMSIRKTGLRMSGQSSNHPSPVIFLDIYDSEAFQELFDYLWYLLMLDCIPGLWEAY